MLSVLAAECRPDTETKWY